VSGDGLSLPGLLMIGTGVVLTYAGIQDPAGGPVGVVRSVLSGKLPVPGALGTGLGTVAGGLAGQTAANAVLSVARSYLGVPYRWGGADRTGMDCSGLVLVAYRDGAGITLPHSAAAQGSRGRVVPRDQAAPGDLACWGPRGAYFHIGIVVDASQMIVAPTWGKSVMYQTWNKIISGVYPDVVRIL
jgi:hypothetical protein